MVVSLVHAVVFNNSSMEHIIPVDRKVPYDSCGCGARSAVFVQRVNSRASRFTTSTTGLDSSGRVVADRKRGKPTHSDLVVKAEKHVRRAPGRYRRSPFSSTDFAERRELIRRARRTFGFLKDRVGEEARNFMSAAAAVSLSWTLCSSAVAEPLAFEGSVQVPTTPVSENLKTHVESQLRLELQSQIKLQKEWLDEIGQPLSQWSIDDNLRKSLEEKARNRLDESGKSVSKLEMLQSEVVPIFKPPVAVPKKEKVASAPRIATPQEASLDKQSTQNPPVAVEAKDNPLTAPKVKTTVDGGTELVAVAAVPLGPVVSAASRTVGSAASMAAEAVAQAGAVAPVPGVSLLTRIAAHFGGGGVAGAMGATLVYPLDTIKTRMQAQSDEDEEPQFRDEWDCLRQLVAKEGVGSLYSGLLPQLVGIAPEKAMKLTVNEVLMEVLEFQMPGVGPWALELIAGGGGGFSQVVFTNPMEIVKVRLQTQPKDVQQKNSWDVIKELGVVGLYNGSAMTMARDIPSSAIFFAIYTLIRQVYPDQNFMAGFMAAIPATILVTPFDVVKTRLQMERGADEVPYENGFKFFVMILHKEGIGALFKGSVARVLKSSPQFGITLMLYNLLCGD